MLLLQKILWLSIEMHIQDKILSLYKHAAALSFSI